MREAKYLREKISGNLFVKVPAFPEGYKAIRLLKEEGINTTATAVINANQALLSARAGASFVAPYVNRIDNLSSDGSKVVEDIVKMLEKHQLETKVIGASFKNAQQVHNTALAGAYGVAVGYDILESCANHILTEKSIEQFQKDWESVYGKGTSIYNLLDKKQLKK